MKPSYFDNNLLRAQLGFERVTRPPGSPGRTPPYAHSSASSG